MKNILIPVLCGAVILVTGCSKQKESDVTALQGTWVGQDLSRATEGQCQLMISGNTLELRCANPKEWYKGTFTLNEDVAPKQLLTEISECPSPQYVGKVAYAIYRIEEGKLTLTGNEPGTPAAPAGFDAAGARTFALSKQ